MRGDAASLLARLDEAQKLIAKWCQSDALALPELKARLRTFWVADAAPRDAPYEEHTQGDDAWAGVRVQRRLPIPSKVFETITSQAPTATLALFPEIGRACITVEHRVYLWDYAAGPSAFEYYELPSSEVVLSVGLVPARRGVFIDRVEHVLVLAAGPTARDGRRVVLLGVEVQRATEHQASSLKLYETAMSAATNGVVMRDFQATDSGRVFCIGSDHSVHELVYQAQESWFRARCYLYNVTQPHLANLVPMLFRNEKPVKHLAVDSPRQLLYVLREGDHIEVYSLPSRDASKAPSQTGSMYGMARNAGFLQAPQDVGTMVWLAPTEADPRSNVVLVAVTDKGYRLYFDDFQRRTWAQMSMRAPPGQPRAASAAGVPSLPSLPSLPSVPSVSTVPTVPGAPGVPWPAAARRTTAALYSRGTFLCAMASSDTTSELYAMMPSAPLSGATVAYGTASTTWQESATLLPLGRGGSVPVLAEVPSRATPTPWRPSAAQTVAPPRVFLALDSNGLTELVERRPADVLLSLLGGTPSGSAPSGGTGSAAPALVDFFSRHGPVDACVSALAMAAGNANVARAERDDVAHMIRLLFGPLAGWPAEPRLPGAATKTARHEALACYVACLVRDVWSEPLVPPAFLSGTAALPPLVASGRLATALVSLTPLQSFLARHAQLWEEERAERDDVAKLGALVTATVEACHFVMFLADHDLRRIVGALPPHARAAVPSLRLAELVASEHGRSLARQLVTSLIESQSGAHASVDAMAEALQARCGSFCSADDVRQYKASECLRQASELAQRAAAPRAPIDEALHASLRLLLPGAASIPLEKLAQVCATYAELGFASGAVQLALACARAADPNDVAYAFRADGCPGDEPTSHRRAVYERRRDMYALALEALAPSKDGALSDDVLGVATASDDALFHEELYTCLLQQGRTSELLVLHTPFLVEFLSGTPVLLHGESRESLERRLRDLLWQWYVRQGDYLAAAETLGALAHATAYPLQLHERIEYLALAVGNAKSVRAADASQVPDFVEFATQLEEDLEVAQVQAKVLSALPADARDQDVATLLNTTLLNVTALYRDVAEPLGMLEELLLLVRTAQYQDTALVAGLWEQLLTRAHNASAPAQAPAAVAALVTDVYTRLGGSDVACPLELLLPLLERYAYDVYIVSHGDVPPASGLAWPDGAGAAQLPHLAAGWAPLVLVEAGAPPALVLELLRGLLTSAPAPWNTHSGVGFLLPDMVALIDTWLSSRRAAAESVPAHAVEQTLHECVLKWNSGRYSRDGDSVEKRLEQAQTLAHKVRRLF